MSQATVTIRPKEFVELKRTGKTLDLIDVRTPAEYRGFTRKVPTTFHWIDSVRLASPSISKATTYLICHTGSRANKACEMFQTAGNANVVT